MDDITAFFEDFIDYIQDPWNLALVIVSSVLCTLLLIWFESRGDSAQPPNPMQGSGFMKGYKRPEMPKKTTNELRQLEDRKQGLPLISLDELAKHKGGKTKPWVCLKGVVYDVSANEVYDAQGGYNVFAGHDASVSLATMLFDKIKERDWRGCSHEQLECLEEWVLYYKERYGVVGYLAEEYAAHKKKAE